MLTANYEYSRSNKENLPLQIQVQLFEKRKTFCLLLYFWNVHSILKFWKNESPSSSISGVIDYEKCDYLNE